MEIIFKHDQNLLNFINSRLAERSGMFLDGSWGLDSQKQKIVSRIANIFIRRNREGIGLGPLMGEKNLNFHTLPQNTYDITAS